MARYLVTGGAGFIGSHLVDNLINDGHDVIVVDDLSTGKRVNVNFRALFISEDIIRILKYTDIIKDVDAVFHLAAIASVARSNEEWLETHQANQTATISVLNAARNKNIPVVYASSAAVYGNKSYMVSESDTLDPMSAYGVDKYGSELHAKIAYSIHKVPTIGFRFFNVYGPRQDPSSPYSGVISIFAKSLLEGKDISIFGDGQQVRDFIYVGDIVRYLRAGLDFIQQYPSAIISNACTGIGTTITDLAITMSEIVEIMPNVKYNPARVGDITYSVGNPLYGNTILNIFAETPLKEGLITTLNSLK